MATNETSAELRLPEDSRYSLLTDALDQASHKIIKKILSQKAFSECLPLMKKKHPELLSNLHAAFSQKLELRMKEELTELYTGLCLKEKLDFLDKLDSEQADLSQSEIVWRPTGDPTRDMLAYDIPILQQHKDELSTYLKELKADNDKEKTKILEVVQRVGEMEKAIEDLLVQKEKAIEVLSSIPSL